MTEHRIDTGSLEESGWTCLVDEKPPYLCLCEWTIAGNDWTVFCEYQQLGPFDNPRRVFWRLTGIGKMQMENRDAPRYREDFR